MLSSAQGHALFIGTPKGKNHFYDLFLKGQSGTTKENGWWSCRYTTTQGENVNHNEIIGIKKNLDIKIYKQEYEASFESFSGQCLFAFSRKKSIKTDQYNPDQPLHIGMDFNINPMTATVWQENIDHENEVTTTQIDEIILETSNTNEISKEIIKRYGKIKNTFSGNSISNNDHITIYPDPAGQARKTSASGHTDISILLSHGFKVQTNNHSPRVRDRLNFMNSMFENSFGKRRAFVSPNCIKSIESYERYSFVEGTSEPDKRQGYDHIVDASGYYLYFRFKNKSNNIDINKILDR